MLFRYWPLPPQLRWLLVLYLRAYATILREQAGQALPPSLRTTPIEAYRRLLRDLTVDLAQDVAEFRATRVLETSHYHRTGKFQNNGHQVLYLDTGAGPRWEYVQHEPCPVRQPHRYFVFHFVLENTGK